jgi:N-acetylglucosamine kinase-like BadF-type ATPase
MNKYYLGIDGGGTKTKVVVIDNHENMIYEAVGSPSSIDTVDGEKTFLSIEKALDEFFKVNPDVFFTSIFAGIGGIVFETDYKYVENLLSGLKGVNNDTLIQARNDMENALYSGLCFNEGIVLIVGTGMVAYGRDTYGNTHKCGGWGYKVGDEGSGYDLGLKAIKHVVRVLDNRLARTDFAEEIATHIGIKQATDIVPWMNLNYTNRTVIADLAPIVTKHANLGNSFAKEIVDEATSELALAVQGVYHQLKLKNEKLVIVGSLGNASGYFKNQLHQKIHRISQFIEIIGPQIDPALAAAMMALKNMKS